jgi:hypothetical protein
MIEFANQRQAAAIVAARPHDFPILSHVRVAGSLGTIVMAAGTKVIRLFGEDDISIERPHDGRKFIRSGRGMAEISGQIARRKRPESEPE